MAVMLSYIYLTRMLPGGIFPYGLCFLSRGDAIPVHTV